MSFLTALIKGLGWGIGLAAGIVVVTIAYDSLYVSKKDRLLRETAEKFVEKDNKKEMLTGAQLEGISVEVNQVEVIEGKIVIAGTVKNSTSNKISAASISLSVFKGSLPIERCHGTMDGEAAPNSEQLFSSICRENWNQLSNENLSVKAKMSTAWL